MDAAVASQHGDAAMPAPTGERILLNTGPTERWWHRLETYLRCPVLFAQTQLPSATGKPRLHASGEALVRGSLGHVGLAHLYARKQCRQQGRDPELYYPPDEAIALVAPTFGEQGIYLRDLAINIVTAYHQTYQHEGLEVVAVAQQFRTMVTLPGRTPRLFTQRFDLVLRDQAGKIWVWDHKLVHRVDAKAMALRYTLSGQFLAMSHFGPMLWGSAFGGIRINLCGAQEPHKFKRLSPMPAPAAGAKFPKLVLDVEDDIERQMALGLAPEDWGPPRFNEHACVGRYDICPAYDICQWGSALQGGVGGSGIEE